MDALNGYLVCLKVEGRGDRWEPQSFFFYEPQALEYVDWAVSVNPRLSFYVWTSTWFAEFAAIRAAEVET